MPNRYDKYIICGLILFIGICHVIMSGTMPLLGDDLVYSSYQLYYDGNIWYYPRWIIRHIVYANGRLPNLIAPLLLYFLPEYIIKILSGIMVMVWLGSMLCLMGLKAKDLLLSIIAISLVVFTFTWWDSFTLYTVQLNYIWAISVVLLYLFLLLNYNFSKRISKFLFCIFALCAGSMHEAATLPLILGLCYYIYISKWHLRVQRYKLVSIICFSLIEILYIPGIFNRLHDLSLADDYWYNLIFRSAYYVIILVAITLFLHFYRPKTVSNIWHSQFVIFFWGAIFSTIILAFGGIVGRSGWFAQTYALIALFIIIRQIPLHLNPVVKYGVSFLLITAIVLHYCLWCTYQLRLSREASEVIDLYIDSDNGSVNYDFTLDNETPWYIMRKAHGVPSPTDFYVISTLRDIVGDSTKILTVLPMEARTYDGDSLFWLRRHADFICRTLPKNASDTIEGGFGRRTVVLGDHTYTLIPYVKGSSTYYYGTPKFYDPRESVFN